LFTDVVKTATSKERLKRLFHIPLYSNALYLMSTSAVTALLGFVFWVVVARFYSPDDVGLASAIITAVGLLALISYLGLGAGLIRFLPGSGKDANSMVNTVFTIGGSASILAAFIFVAGLGFWSPVFLFLRQNPVYLASFILLVIVSTLSQLTDNAFIARRQAKFVLARGLIFGILKIPLPILLAAFFHSFGVFASWGISLAVAFLLSIFLFLPRAQPGYRPAFTISRKVAADILHFSLANYIGTLFWSAPVMVLPIMVVNLLGAEPNAYFYVAWSISSALTMVPTAASTSLFAEGSHAEERLESNVWRSLKMVFVLLVPAVGLVLALADKLLLLFGSTYSDNATTLLRILTISALPSAINLVYLGIKRVEERLKIIVGLGAFTGVVTLLLSYLLLPHMGINGIGIAWLISQGIIALWIAVGWLKRNVSLSRQSEVRGASIFKRAIRYYQKHGLKAFMYNVGFRLVIEYINLFNRWRLRAVAGKVIREINGSKMYLDVADEGLSRDLIIDSVREAYILETIKRELNEGDVVVDIGANIGYYALLEAKIVGEKGKVYAIEPVPENMELLQKNIQLNRYSNIEVFQLAIGNKKGFAPTYVAKRRNISSLKKIMSHIESGMISHEITVEVTKLDDFLQGKVEPDIIRMDVEGYEYQIVKGMERTLEKGLPLTLFIELHFNILEKEESIELLQTLREAGFEIADITSEIKIRGYTRHKLLGNITSYLERKEGEKAPLGHTKLSIDDILAKTAILDGEWGALEICFKKKAPPDQY